MKLKNNLPLIIFIASISVITVFLCSMFMGRYSINFSETIRFFTGGEISDISRKVIANLRIPRTLISALVGIALSLSGAIYQSIFNNKLVSPDLLGVSSGASVGACFAILIGSSGIVISIFSFASGLIAVAMSAIIAKLFGNKNKIVLLLSGIAVSGLMSSMVGMLKYLADDESKLAEMTYWLLGDVSSSNMNDVFVTLPIVVICSTIAVLMSWKLNIVSLGEKEAKALGTNYKLSVMILIICATLLTAGAVAVSGTIGWIGLVIPNLVRLIFGNDNRKVIPLSIVTGAIFMMVVDTICRSIAPSEIPLSIVTGIIGTPIFVFAMFKRRQELR